jgi:hypothetical protein
MEFKNSPAYVQRRMDILLREYPLARAYIDDVVVASKTLDEHVQHLRTLFQFFSSIGISIKPTKAFIGCPFIRLLGQHVDSLGLSTAREWNWCLLQVLFRNVIKTKGCSYVENCEDLGTTRVWIRITNEYKNEL